MRLYKTGDLAKFNVDGTIQFMGRKDHQVKLHGLRIELGEVEHNIAQHNHVKHVAVLLPKAGPCREKLVAVVSLHEFTTESQPGQTELPVYLDDASVRKQVEEVQQHLKERVLEYMVPTIWIVIEAWPLLISAKLNRKLVAQWLVSMESSLYKRLMDLDGQEADDSDMSELEKTLRGIYSRVLNLSTDQIPIDRPFLSLGGDSLCALRVLSHCRNAGISLGLEDVLTSSGIRDLAARAVGEREERRQETTIVQATTVQSTLICEQSPGEIVTILLNEKVTPDQFKAALNAVISRHAVLRSRFKNEGGHWVQTILPSTEQSLCYRVHTVDNMDEAQAISKLAQLAIGNESVFSTDFLLYGEQKRALIAAHPAVVDETSWKIILQDIEAHLIHGSLTNDCSGSFYQWAKQVSSNELATHLFTSGVQTPDSTYSSETDASDALTESSITLNQGVTALLLSTQVHETLRTQPQDLILTAIFHAHNQVFPGRSLPVTYTIDSNRSSDDPKFDFSSTVGCFKTHHLLEANISPAFGVLDTLKRVKDARRGVLESDTDDLVSLEPQQSSGFELLFNYPSLVLGDILSGSKPITKIVPPATVCVNRRTRRTSMMDVIAILKGKELQINFCYSRLSQDQGMIQSWIHSITDTISNMMDHLLNSPPQYSLSDFPLLPLTYDGLDRLVTDRLPSITPDITMIEDVCPCSPMQQGLLLNQSRPDSSAYQHFNITQVAPRKPTGTLDPTRLAKAWGKVVERHSSLRTVFMESSAQIGLFDQVVLRHVDANVVIVECASDDEANDVFRKQDALSFSSGKIPHRLTICAVSENRLLVKLDINHAIIDGSSIVNLIRDLSLSYEDRLYPDPAFKFSRYIEYTRKLPLEGALEFWKQHLDGLQPCIFPNLASFEEVPGQQAVEDTQINFSFTSESLSKFCQRANLSFANVFQAAWALVLRAYTESDDVCFGMISSGRDVPLPGIENGVGAFLTMLVCRLVLNKDTKISHVLSKAATELVASLPHQHCGLANIGHAVKTASSSLFNTIITFNSDEEVPELQESSISVKNISINDPTEYALTLDIWFSKEGIRATLRHWTNYLTLSQARNIASAFDQAVVSILSNMDMTVDEVDLVSEHHIAKLVEFNGPIRPRSGRLMLAKFEENVSIRPDAQAVEAWDGSWTYKELDDITNRLAYHFCTMGVGPEVIVPHCFQKSCWAVITMMSIVKAGGAFVGLDPSHPVKRLERFISAVDATIVCTNAENSHLFRNVEKLVIVDQQLVDSLPDMPGRPCSEVRPSNTACVVFTSGTTGEPKAIVIEHSSMASNADLMGPVLKLDSSSRVFQFASYTFDVSNQDIFTTLQRGGCICVPSEEDRVNDPGAAIRRLGANWANLTSTVMSLIQPAQVPSLKQVFQLGEPLAHETKDLWAGELELHNSKLSELLIN